MPKTDQAEVARILVSKFIEAKRAELNEFLQAHPPQCPTYLVAKQKREKSGFKMSEAWHLARQKTLLGRSVAEAASNALCDKERCVDDILAAITDVENAVVSVRLALRTKLFTDVAATRLIRLLAKDPVGHYTNYFARLSEPDVPTCEIFHEVFRPDLWIGYQLLLNLLQGLITDCLERAELNLLDDNSRGRWAELGELLGSQTDTEFCLSAHDADELVNGILSQDRKDKGLIALQGRHRIEPKPLSSNSSIFEENAQKYVLSLWMEYRADPGTLLKAASVTRIHLDLNGRKVSYKDVYEVFKGSPEMRKYNITSAQMFEHKVRAAQTRLRRSES